MLKKIMSIQYKYDCVVCTYDEGIATIRKLFNHKILY